MSARWVETEELAAQWFRERGWEHCQRAGRGKRGADLLGMPGLVPEIKSTRLPEVRALAQHDGRAGVPFVLWRPPKFGPVSIGLWPVWFRLGDATTLLRDAGYGEKVQ